MSDYVHTLPPGRRFRLSELDPDYTAGFTSKKQARKRTQENLETLHGLQEQLYADGGQALEDPGYIEGDCDQPYATAQFRGRVSFPQDVEEKRHGLETMIKQLEPNPEPVLEKNITPEALEKVNIGRVDIEYMSGKRYG